MRPIQALMFGNNVANGNSPSSRARASARTPARISVRIGGNHTMSAALGTSPTSHAPRTTRCSKRANSGNRLVARLVDCLRARLVAEQPPVHRGDRLAQIRIEVFDRDPDPAGVLSGSPEQRRFGLLAIEVAHDRERLSDREVSVAKDGHLAARVQREKLGSLEIALAELEQLGLVRDALDLGGE